MENSKKSPEWLNIDFLQKALSSYKNDKSVTVLNFEIARNFGEHYGSEMVQCSIDFTTGGDKEPVKQNLKVVIKSMSLGEEKISFIRDASSKIFNTEIKMYTETIPAVTKLFENNVMKIDFAPELIYAAQKPFLVIILRDLSGDGFSSPTKPPKSIDDSKTVIQRLAQFHAGSFYLAEKEKVDFSAYDVCLFNFKHVVDDLFKDLFTAFREVVATWEGYEDFLPRIEFMRDNMGKIGPKSYVPNKPGCGYNVLNHGDFHVRNTLMKTNSDGRLDSFRMIDFQLCCYCSPAVDINCMYEMIQIDENCEIPKDEIVTYYHKEFVKALKTFGYSDPPPSLLDLKVELLKHGKISVFLEVCITPFTFVDDLGLKLDDILKTTPENNILIKKKMYEHPKCTLIFKKALKTWLNNGWMEME